jgi:hypothetical protein
VEVPWLGQFHFHFWLLLSGRELLRRSSSQ